MEIAKVTSKGQITIPVSIRRRLSIKEGDKLLFIDSPDGVVMVNPDMLQNNNNDEGASIETGAATPESAPVNAASFKTAEPASKETTILPTEETEHKTKQESPASHANRQDSSKPGTQIKGVDINALLDEIRSIGSKI